jgi:HAD superfamily hydrolase (TIGR01509 family)
LRADYHRVVLGALGVNDPPAALLDELEQPRPAAELVEVFPDVVPALDALKAAAVPVAVVTDNWSTIRDLYADLGLSDSIDAFVISEELGCTKPDPRMYRAGSDALGLGPDECAFIDDDPELVAAAIDLGYHGFVIDRATPTGVHPVPTLTSLLEIVGLVDRSASTA